MRVLLRSPFCFVVAFLVCHCHEGLPSKMFILGYVSWLPPGKLETGTTTHDAFPVPASIILFLRCHLFSMTSTKCCEKIFHISVRYEAWLGLSGIHSNEFTKKSIRWSSMYRENLCNVWVSIWKMSRRCVIVVGYLLLWQLLWENFEIVGNRQMRGLV